MGVRYDLPRVSSTTPPSLVNHDMGKFALIGGLLGGWLGGFLAKAAIFAPAHLSWATEEMIGGGLLAFAAPFVVPLVTLGVMALAAKYGGRIGKAKQEREMAEGKTVAEPTYLNKGIVSGWALGMAASVALSLIGAPIALSFIGAAIGSVIQKNNLQKDFNRAVAQRNYDMAQARANQPAQGLGLGVGPYMDSITPQEMQALEARQNVRPDALTHAQTAMQNQPALADPQR